MPDDVLFESSLDELPLLARGKVRDIYEIDEQHLLFVTSDRISAFDVVLPTPIPGKGALLTSISGFWFEKSSSLIRNHLTGLPLNQFVSNGQAEALQSRSIVVKRLKPLPVEAIVRGYLIGSGWKDYQHSGQVCGIDLPEGLRIADRLPEPIYTPSTKAAVGDHDINISFDESCSLIGKELAEKVREVSLKIYTMAAEFALQKGIIIADTKFEFGLDEQGELLLADEVLTPDSSRFWPLQQYQPGTNPQSFDKQFIRDYLETLDWNKKAPGPALPADVVEKTRDKYQLAYHLLTGD